MSLATVVAPAPPLAGVTSHGPSPILLIAIAFGDRAETIHPSVTIHARDSTTKGYIVHCGFAWQGVLTPTGLILISLHILFEMERDYELSSPVSGPRRKKQKKNDRIRSAVNEIVQKTIHGLKELGQDQLITRRLKFDVDEGKITLFQLNNDIWLPLKTSDEMWGLADELEKEQNSRSTPGKRKRRMESVWILRYRSSSISVHRGSAPPRDTKKRRWQKLVPMVNQILGILITGKIGASGLRVLDALACESTWSRLLRSS